MNNAKRRKVKNGRINKAAAALLSLLIVVSIAAGVVTLTNVSKRGKAPSDTGSAASIVTPSDNKIDKTYTATISATGDLLIHQLVYESAEQADGSYNFDDTFKLFKSYVSKSDYSVANLETTLAGTELGYNYSGYPCFNSPDAIAEGAKNAGFDMLLTANNHAYDTRLKGMKRTVEVVDALGLDRIGTYKDTSEKRYIVKTINNIKIGMICYTYETDERKDKVALNGINMNDEAAGLVNAFSYGELDTFYSKIETQIADMKSDGAEAVMLFIHWGDEFHIEENKTQQKIAQKMCDLGVDVIVGGHPHVVQPVDLLTSSTDANHKTVCVYSMGDTLCNIPGSRNGLEAGYALDGMLFSVTFEKNTEGVVSVKSVDILPTFCNIYTSVKTGKPAYEIVPLDTDVDDWKTSFNLSDTSLKKCKRSLERTTEIVEPGLKKVNDYLSNANS